MFLKLVELWKLPFRLSETILLEDFSTGTTVAHMSFTYNGSHIDLYETNEHIPRVKKAVIVQPYLREEKVRKQ